MLGKPMRESGITLLEVLIAIVIMSVGLLGLAGLFATAARAELEAYQRVQALSYLSDMADRLAANRNVAGCYVTSASYGASATPPASPCTAAAGASGQYDRAVADIAAWNALLLGAAEQSGGANVGGIVGARGCVELGPTTTISRDYRVSVSWQGVDDLGTATVLDSTLCGATAYSASPGRHRIVTSVLKVPVL